MATDMIFPKPKHRKQRSQHKSNPMLDGSELCEICHIATAVETHELRSGKGYRLICQELSFQLKLCKTCHDNWHLRMTKVEKKPYRAMKQKEIIERTAVSKAEWIERLGESWL